MRHAGVGCTASASPVLRKDFGAIGAYPQAKTSGDLGGMDVSVDTQAATALDGAAMGWPWALPFVGILLSIATGPLLFPKIWHGNYGKVAIGWALLTLLPIALIHGGPAMLAAFVHAILAHYLSFILLLFVLYTVAGGILVTGTMHGTPWTNTAMLALGTGMASIVGTTGAAMILIRPLIRANKARKYNTHVFIFFIILVANVGGRSARSVIRRYSLGSCTVSISFGLHGIFGCRPPSSPSCYWRCFSCSIFGSSAGTHR